MVVTCVLFLLLWLGYAWTWQGSSSSAVEESRAIQVRAPILQQPCDVHEVPCIDDCSFLCVEKNAQCIGGVCQPTSLPTIACDTQKGGVKMMVKDPVPHWTCVCSDSRFYRGDACNELNPDVCESGSFFYQSRTRYVCVCPPPLELVRIESKPHCVGPERMGFYDSTTMSQRLL